MAPLVPEVVLVEASELAAAESSAVPAELEVEVEDVELLEVVPIGAVVRLVLKPVSWPPPPLHAATSKAAVRRGMRRGMGRRIARRPRLCKRRSTAS